MVEVELSTSTCYAAIAQHSALMERLVIEARALFELQGALVTNIGDVTMSEMYAMTHTSLGRLQALVTEATNVTNNFGSSV